ncbi:DUF2336 domain-containing protein [Sphingomonas tabacisoli]|uniref:DUF2336 domain-containing protein n=1 Tax=Sphingomonas tabacisoli TaxID=2249466 RepID=A0ABW4I3W7_9SPHN
MALTAHDGGNAAPTGPDRLLAEAAQVARQADARLTAALNDLFLPDFVRPTDSQRAAMANMLDSLVTEIDRELRAGLIARFGDAAPPVLGVARIPIIRPIFDRAGVLRDRELAALLLTRAEEHRIAQAIRRVAQINPEPAPVIQLGVTPELEAALQVAENRRTGSHGEPNVTIRDLSADLLHKLLWWGAAALRDYLERSTTLEAGARDEALASVVATKLGTHDEGQTLDATAMRVAISIGGDDALLFELFRAGRFSLFVALLAVRARIDFASAFMLAADPGIGALAVLLRAVAASTQVAAPILLQMAAINRLSEAKLEERVNDFLDLDVAAAQDAVRPWRLERAFRHAIADIGRERRQR